MTAHRLPILLVEDNPGDARLIRELLGQASDKPFELEHADRLATGLARLAAGGVAAVLLDLSLPDSHGLDTLACVRAHAPQAPIVVLTGREDEALGLQLVQSGAQDYLIKGQVDGNGLARSIRYAIERKQAQAQLVQANGELALLNRLGQLFNSSLDLDEVLASVLEEVERLMQVVGAFWLADPQTDELVCRQASGPAGTLLRGWRLRPGQGIAGWVAQHGDSLNVPDASADERFFKGVDQQTGSVSRSILTVPLKAKQTIIGVLQVLDSHVARFNATDVQLIESLAASAAIAVENARLYSETERLRAFNANIVHSMEEGIIVEDAHGQITFVNPATSRLLGVAPEELVGRHYTVLLAAEEIVKAEAETAKRSRGVAGRYETVVQRNDGRRVPVLVSAQPIIEHERLSGVLSVLTDISERKRAEEELRSLSLRDELTGLYNRRGFLMLAEQQLKLAHRLQRGLFVLYADMDRLKWINDTCGHREGDRALVEVAGILREAFRESDLLARMGGDEFVILAVETSGEHGEALAARLQQRLEARNAQGGQAYPLSLSVGAARRDPAIPRSIEELLAQADQQMYAQKRLKHLRFPYNVHEGQRNDG